MNALTRAGPHYLRRARVSIGYPAVQSTAGQLASTRSSSREGQKESRGRSRRVAGADRVAARPDDGSHRLLNADQPRQRLQFLAARNNGVAQPSPTRSSSRLVNDLVTLLAITIQTSVVLHAAAGQTVQVVSSPMKTRDISPDARGGLRPVETIPAAVW